MFEGVVAPCAIHWHDYETEYEANEPHPLVSLGRVDMGGLIWEVWERD